MTEAEFLEKKVFVDLKNVNDGFDDTNKQHFSEWDFEIVLQRAEYFGLGIYTVEAWLNGEIQDIADHERFRKKATDSTWYRKALLTFKTQQSGLTFAATYKVSPKLLAK